MIGLVALLALAQAADLEGHYALETRVRTHSKVPLARTTSTEVTTALVDVVQGPQGLEHHQRTCDVDIQSRSPLARPLVPDAFVHAMPPVQRPVEVGAAPGSVRYHVDLGVSHVGYDPALGDLPTTATDPAVLDWEGDGRPGATVLVHVFGFGTFGLDVVQRTHAILDGAVGTDGVIEGEVRTVSLAHRVLSADRRFLEPSPEVSAEPGTFRMVRIPAGTTCDDLTGRRSLAARSPR